MKKLHAAFLFLLLLVAASATNLMAETQQAAGTNALFTRTFRVDPNTFVQGLDSAVGLKSTNLVERTRDLFARAGADLLPPKLVYFNDRSGTIFVRGSLADLEVVEQVIQKLNTPPPQVHISAKFVEVPEDGSRNLFLGTLGSVFTNSNGVKPFSFTSGNTGGSTNANNTAAGITGIFTPAQYKVVIRALEQREGVEVLSMPEVTTLSGRQAQLQVTDSLAIVTGDDAAIFSATNSTNILPRSQFLTGPILDVLPSVLRDGRSIQMTLMPTVTEFMGYEKPGTFFPDSRGKNMSNTNISLPHFRIRQATAVATVLDGQTIVIGGFIAKQKTATNQSASNELTFISGEFASSPQRPEKKNLLVFITPTIVDPAANRVNTPADIPYTPPHQRR